MTSASCIACMLLASLTVWPGSVLAHTFEHPLTKVARRLSAVKVADAQSSGIVLTTNCTAFKASGQYVNVSWSGVASPSVEDLVALYAPADADPTKVVPVQMAYSNESTEHMAHGRGWAVFRLINLRQSYGFKFIKNGFEQPIVMASAPRIKNKVPNQPRQGHLSVHQDAHTVVLQWISGSKKPQKVQYNTDGKAHGRPYSFSAASAPSTYTPEDMCGFPANSAGWMTPGYIHTALISLSGKEAPDTRISYRYGSKDVGWSQKRMFQVAPRPGYREDPPLRFLSMNDISMTNLVLYNKSGSLDFYDLGANSAKLPPYLKRENVHVALVLGDLAYAKGFAPDWDYFGEQFESSFTRWPVAVTMGNHERDWPHTGDAFNDTVSDSGGECGNGLTRRYYTPAAARGSNSSSKGAGAVFYSFEMGSVHFLILDSEMPSDPQSEQGRFVAADLASVSRTRTPWIVVGLHRMMWAPSTYRKAFAGDLDNSERLQQDLEEMFINHQVDVVIQGHEHAYSRTCMLYKGTCIDQQQQHSNSSHTNITSAANVPVTRAPVYILGGNSGQSFTNSFPKPLPDWAVVGLEERNGYLRFQANFTFFAMEEVSTDDGSIMDSLTLRRP